MYVFVAGCLLICNQDTVGRFSLLWSELGDVMAVLWLILCCSLNDNHLS